MGTTKSAIARLEAAGKHAPSVASLKKYAAAVGCTLKIELVPASPRRRKLATPVVNPTLRDKVALRRVPAEKPVYLMLTPIALQLRCIPCRIAGPILDVVET